MARWLLVLLLTVGVGLGVVDGCPEGRCAEDVEGAAMSHAPGDCAGDDGGEHGDPEGDACPPLCAGCLRVSAEPPLRLSLATVTLAAAIAPGDVIHTPIAAPPLHGLFRPPRA